MNGTNRMREEQKRSAPRGPVRTGGLVPVLDGGRRPVRGSQPPYESWCEQDRHEAPAHRRIDPLSLQDGGEARTGTRPRTNRGASRTGTRLGGSHDLILSLNSIIGPYGASEWLV